MGPSPYDWGPCGKRRLGHRHVQQEDHLKTQGEDGRLQAKDRGLGKTNPANTLILDVQLPEL